jgi:tetratricopeptide (TPR) repeat protein
MPGAGHMVHMPSHIFLRLGDFQKSAEVNESAAHVDRRYIERSGGAKSCYSLMYYSHNLHFISYVRMMQGDFAEALDYARKLKKNVEDEVDAMPMIAPYATFDWLVLTRFSKWNEMLSQPAPNDKNLFENAMYRYARALAFAGLGRVQEAELEHERMAEIAGSISEQDMLMNNSAGSVIAIGLVDLEAKLARSKGNADLEIANLKSAVALQDRLNYMEPPEWHYPIREALGGALLRSGNVLEAERIFREDLEKNPRNGRSLFGLMEALKMQGDLVDLEWVKKEFKEAWKYAPTSLNASEL